MDQALKLIEKILLERAMQGHAPLSLSNNMSTYLKILIAVFMIIGLGFCFSALNIYLSTILPVYQVQAILGACFIAVSLLLVIGIYAFYRMKIRHMNRIRQNVIDGITDGIDFLDAEMANIDFIRENPKATCLIAASLGYLFYPKH